MTSKIAGAILLVGAGLMIAITYACEKISDALIIAGFYAGNMAGIVPDHRVVTPMVLVIIAMVVLTLFGLFFLFGGPKPVRGSSS